MNDATKNMIREWMVMHHGDAEGLARWMRDSLRLCGIREARAFIAEAMA